MNHTNVEAAAQALYLPIENTVFETAKKIRKVMDYIIAQESTAIQVHQKGMKSESPRIKELAQAFAEQILGHAHDDQQRLGYTLASLPMSVYESGADKMDRPYWQYLDEIQGLGFDFAEYVFEHTHYDECQNGYFFRRS